MVDYSTLITQHLFSSALYLCIPCYLIFTTLFWLVGVVMYAYFSKCDPLANETIQKTDQVSNQMFFGTKIRSICGVMMKWFIFAHSWFHY